MPRYLGKGESQGLLTLVAISLMSIPLPRGVTFLIHLLHPSEAQTPCWPRPGGMDCSGANCFQVRALFFLYRYDIIEAPTRRIHS